MIWTSLNEALIQCVFISAVFRARKGDVSGRFREDISDLWSMLGHPPYPFTEPNKTRYQRPKVLTRT